MSSIKSVFLHLFQQHRFVRTSAVNVIHKHSTRNASSSTISSSKQLNPTENHESDVVVSMFKSCGFAEADIAELVAKDPLPSSATGLENSESAVFSFFKSYGFPDAHIAKLVAKDPRILKSKVGKTLKPKLDLLAEYGMSGSFVHELIAADPGILFKSLDDHLKPTLSLLKTCLGSNEKVAAAVKRSSYLLSYGNGLTMEDNLNFLVSEGVPIKSISKLISLRPRFIMCQVDRMVHVVKSAKQFGFRPDDPMIVYALDAIHSMSESTMYKKTELLKNLLGLSEEEVNSIFKRCPRCFCYSEDKMKSVINFFVNTMQAEPSILLANPAYFSFSVDKKLVPRYNVFKILESKNLLKKGRKLTGTLRESEKLFEIKYVVKYLDQVPDLMDIYHGFSKTSNSQSVINTTSAVIQKHSSTKNASTISSSRKTLKLNPTGPENHECAVLSFFKSYGFSDAQIAKVLAKEPRILKSKVDKTLKPKLDFLADYGMSGSFVHEVIADNPGILFKSLDAHLEPTLTLLETCLGSKEIVFAAIKRSSYLLSRGNRPAMEDNLNFLLSEGVPIETLSRLISLKPTLIMYQVDRMVHAVKFAKQVGFRMDDPMLVYAIDTIISMSESTLYKKTELLKSLLGLSEEEVNSMFKRYPRFFIYSEDKFKDVVNFFLNTMQAEPSILLANPAFFSFSVDKKLVPRYNVFKVLESKNLLKKGRKFTGTLQKSEKWFEINYVVEYLDQVPNLMDIYRGCSKTSNTQSVTSTTTL